MNPVLITGAAILTLAALLALVHVPLGTWIHRVFTDEQDWRLERAVYRIVGVDPARSSGGPATPPPWCRSPSCRRSRCSC
jgi:K+-transporting ATPase A subunit